MSTTPSIAFISHATDDKDRFVTAFATKLRTSGVEAWVDHWEIRPGDSLVDRIFEEGLKNADVVIVVLSRNSADRAWVREELNVSVVSRIQKKTKIIPVILDSLGEDEIPISLRSTLYVRVPDLDSYDEQFNQIRDAIFDHATKPALGSPPAYTQAEVVSQSGLTRIDSLILKLVGELAIEEDSGLLHPHLIVEQATPLGITPEAAVDSLLVLDGRGYVQVEMGMRDQLILLRTTTFGFQEYARAYVVDYDSVATGVVVRLVNHKEEVSELIAHSLDRSHFLIRHILDLLEAGGLVTLVRFNNYSVRVLRISPELARSLS